MPRSNRQTMRGVAAGLILPDGVAFIDSEWIVGDPEVIHPVV